MAKPPRLVALQSLDDLLLYRISRLLGVAGGMVTRLCEGRFGITRREWRVLAVLAQHDGLLSSALAAHAQLDRARTSRAVSSLQAKHLLRREVQASDLRKARLSLTEQGRALYDALFPLTARINQELLAALAPAEVAQLETMLNRLQDRAHTLAAAADLPKVNRRRGARRTPTRA